MISIIVPVFNNELYIARCLDSLSAQTHQDFEVIVINDGSKDQSGRIIQEYAQRDHRIRCFYQENQGVSVARNAGLDNAKGDFVLFVDGDDYLDNDVLDKLYSILIQHDLDCVSYMFRHVGEENVPIQEAIGGEDIFYTLSSPKESARFFDTTARHVFYSSQQHLFKNDIIQANHLRFAQGIICGEDALFARMYAMFVKKGCILSSFCGYNYFHHPKSCTQTKKDPWQYVIVQKLKAGDFLFKYIVKKGKNEVADYLLANLAWEWLLHFIAVEQKNPRPLLQRKLLTSRLFVKVFVPYLLQYGSLQRKIMTMVFLVSHKLFGIIIKS